MRQRTKELPPLTWEQAEILGLATANGFKAIGIPAGTVRYWATEGLITAIGKAPGGAHLYEIATVSRTSTQRGRAS